MKVLIGFIIILLVCYITQITIVVIGVALDEIATKKEFKEYIDPLVVFKFMIKKFKELK